MFDYSPADDTGRLYDYADANDPDDDGDWTGVQSRYPWNADNGTWFQVSPQTEVK